MFEVIQSMQINRINEILKLKQNFQVVLWAFKWSAAMIGYVSWTFLTFFLSMGTMTSFRSWLTFLFDWAPLPGGALLQSHHGVSLESQCRATLKTVNVLPSIDIFCLFSNEYLTEWRPVSLSRFRVTSHYKKTFENYKMLRKWPTVKTKSFKHA